MKLVLLRHGEAEPARTTDAERRLTETGHEQARASAEWIRSQMNASGKACILASPYRRAQETADVVAGVLGLPVRTVDDITPDVDPRRALMTIDAQVQEWEWVVVVSHMPLVAALSAWLTEATLRAGRGFALAEAQILEAELLGPGTAVPCARFAPGLPRG